MRIQLIVFAMLFAATSAKAQLEGPLQLTTLPVDPTAAQCFAAMEQGVYLGRDNAGMMTFWYSGTAYYVVLQPAYLECRATRYIDTKP
jgi:hypothetical protein